MDFGDCRRTSAYTKPLSAVHWMPWNGDNLIACGQPGELPSAPSPLEVTCRNCRRKIAASFKREGLWMPLDCLRNAWAGVARQAEKYAQWSKLHEWSVAT